VECAVGPCDQDHIGRVLDERTKSRFALVTVKVVCQLDPVQGKRELGAEGFDEVGRGWR